MGKKEDVVKKGILLGVGIAAYAEEKAEQLARELVKKGHVNKAEGKRFARSVYQEVRRSGQRINAVVQSELHRMLQTSSKKKRK